MNLKRLLVIDDEPAILEFVRRAATDLGFEVRVTRDPANFMNFYRTFDPDVVVLDIVMPGTDGFDLIRSLAEANCRSHLILISGHDPKYLKAALIIAEVQGIKSVSSLSKPFELADIEVLLRRHL